ncbi:unnamed protein product [Spirodela intermedia]|uniref:Uncharacterized protein n=1 Tax=Spirodela intermedia TaxID=51605 RepID=A0A7I8IU38_SPIIN|nr:unnamed protein product [Spirodela intermedia]CAA6661544.1 unnamed protein product [Spirodela intermedia]
MRVEETPEGVIDFIGNGVSQSFQVHWQGHPSEDDAWILEANLERLQPDQTFDPERIDGERNPSPSAQETPAVRIQPDRRTKTKEPGFRYTA